MTLVSAGQIFVSAHWKMTTFYKTASGPLREVKTKNADSPYGLKRRQYMKVNGYEKSATFVKTRQIKFYINKKPPAMAQ